MKGKLQITREDSKDVDLSLKQIAGVTKSNPTYQIRPIGLSLDGLLTCPCISSTRGDSYNWRAKVKFFTGHSLLLFLLTTS